MRVCEVGGAIANHKPTVDTKSREFGRAGLPHKGGASRLPKTRKGLFTSITQALNLEDVDSEERKVTQTTTPDLVADLRALAGCVQDMAMGGVGI